LLAATGSTVGGTTSGAINGDVVALDTRGISLAFNSTHVATATTISASGLAAAGAVTPGGNGTKNGTAGNETGGLAGDYVITQPVIAPVAGTITALAFTPSATITPVAKTY